MISSLQQSQGFVIGFNNVVIHRNPLIKSSFLPSISLQKFPNFSRISLSKPLHVSSIKTCYGSLETESEKKRFPVICKAYEADRPQEEGAVVEKAESTRKLKIGLYFALLWFLEVIFNTYNKKVLKAFPFPWLTSTLSFAAGALIFLISWATKVAEAPKTDIDFWKTLFPVALAHTIGHVAAIVSMSKVPVSFTQIIKSGEPAFSVLVSRFILGETFPMPVYLSLLPIIGGCGLAALTELNFNMTGFMGAMISNLAFVFKNIFSKRGMKGKSVSGMNYYACLSLLSLLILTPFAIAVEGPQLWAVGWQKAITEIGPHFIWWVAAQSISYHLYNQVSYMSLDEISPLTFSIGKTMKRISVIVSSILIFRTPVQPVNALGAAIAVLGTFLYSQTAVVAAKEEVKQAVADDLNSMHSSPCEWYICDDDESSIRYFVIQGSESLASWKANLLFEPIQFEGLDVIVHRGIYEAAKGIYEQMLPEVHAYLQSHGDRAKFRFTGHSLGGSLSLLVNLMLLIRGQVPRSSLLPVIAIGAPSVMCGGDRLLHKLGLPRSHLQTVIMHRDIVPRAFSCKYPSILAKLLKALNGNFRNDPCLDNQNSLYAPMGEFVILQPDAELSPSHDLLPSGSGMYVLSSSVSDVMEAEKQMRAAQSVFLNTPHPLEILSDWSAYGSGGAIKRDHNIESYLVSVQGVIHEELNRVRRRRRRREHRRRTWWPLVVPYKVSMITGELLTESESLKQFALLVAFERKDFSVIMLVHPRL